MPTILFTTGCVVLAGLFAALPLAAQTAPPAAAAPVALDSITCELPTPTENPQLSARSKILDDSIRVLMLQAARAAGVDTPRGLVVIRPGHGIVVAPGGNVSVETFAAHAGTLLDLVIASARAQQLRVAPIHMERLDPIPFPPCADRPRISSPPRLRNRAAVSRLLEELGRNLPYAFGQDQLELRMILGRDGKIAFAEVTNARTFFVPKKDVLALVHRMKFDVAKVGDVPVDVHISLPITLNFPTMDPPMPGFN